MPVKTHSSPSGDEQNSSSTKGDGELALSEAQREFARVLGELLARRWLQQNTEKVKLPRDEKA